MNANLFAAHEAKFQASVLYDTWGHMDAKPKEVHALSFYVAVTERETLFFKLDMPTLEGGPAFHNDIGKYCYKRFLEKDADQVYINLKVLINYINVPIPIAKCMATSKAK
jgi:hypothetical protein